MKNKYRKLGYVLCAAVVCLCLGYIVHYYAEQKENSQVYEDVRKEAKKQPDVSETPAGTPQPADDGTEIPSPAPEAKPKEEIPVDFTALQSRNPDIYAWIQIPGTNIDYPIVQSSTDDTYYLMHTIDGAEGYPGSIYTESCNSQDFTDFNTVIYGHNMRDGSMFQNLHNYADRSYMDKNPRVLIYTPEHIYEYRIFAAVVYGDEHLIGRFDYSYQEDRQAFLDSVFALRDMGSSFADDVEVTAEDKLLTLSTCIGDRPENRFLVEAVLTDE